MKKETLAALAVILLLLSACGKPPVEDPTTEPNPPIYSQAPQIEPELPSAEPQWTDEELQAMALTLAGECYDDKELDKRRVCEVILNRVSDGRFGGNTIIEVLSAKNQFSGYWTQSRPVSENDLAIAEQALRDWYDNGCEPLSEYLFFSAGENRENSFN